MALAYLLDPFLQYQNRAGVNNVAGYLEVFRMDTDDRATVYTDFNGTLATAHIGIDNDGYAVMIVESGIPYRVEIHGPNGDLFRTWQPVWPVASGGGVSGTSIISTDGSIAIDKSTVGSVTTYDLSSHVEDSTDLLEWIKTEGYTQPADDMIPTYQAGTMEVGGNGVILYAGRYYHVTARVRAVVGSLNPYYNEFDILVRGFDGEGYTTYLDRPVVIDGSTGTTQEWEVSLDIMPDTDVQLSVSTSGLDTYNNSVGLLDMEIHRVYSGAPYIPGGVASKPWVDENYQDKLVPGPGITIDPETNVITATAGDTEIYTVEYTGSVVEGTVFDEAYAAYLAGKTLVVKDGNSTGTLCRYSSAYGLLFVIMQPNLEGSGPTAATEGVVDYMWLYKYGTESRWGTSGLKLLPRSYAEDAGKVLMVDPQYPTSHPIWASLPDLSAYVTDTELETILEGYVTTSALQTSLAGKQDVISDLSDIRAGAAAGATAVQDANYVHTDNNFTDADKSKLAGIQAGAEANVQADWTESDSSSDAYIQNKPANLVQDANYVHTDNNFTNADVTKLSGIAAGAEVNVQPNWNETDTSSDSYIANKPANLVQDANYVHTDNNFTNADATKLSGIASGAEVNVQANWNESDSSSDSFILNKPTIPSGSQLVPSATPSDAGEVLTVDSNGDPTWAQAQAPISAGNGIDITSNTVSAKVDGSTITFNASGEMVASGGSVPPLKPVVAGSNITITENTNDITIAATDTTYSAGNGISISGANAISIDTSVVATQSDLASIPVIGTITL